MGLDGFRLEITSLGRGFAVHEYRGTVAGVALFGLDLDEDTAGAQGSIRAGAQATSDGVRAMTASAPVLLDHLSDVARKQHFDTVLAHLDAPRCLCHQPAHGARRFTKTAFRVRRRTGVIGDRRRGRYDGLMHQQRAGCHRVQAGRGPDRAGAAGRRDSARCDVFGVPRSGQAGGAGWTARATGGAG